MCFEHDQWNASWPERRARSLAFKGFYLASGRRSLVQQVQQLDDLYRAPRPAIDAVAEENLTGLLRHAFKTVPYYRQFSRPAGSQPWEVLRAMPLLTKEIIRREGMRLRSDVPGAQMSWNTSGGSTGEPVKLMQDQPMRRDVTKTKLLYMHWLGFQPGEPHLLIWGQPMDTFSESLSHRERVYRAIHNQAYLNCYEIDTAALQSWTAWIQRHTPSVIEAYADAMFDLSRYVLARGIRVPSPRGIITSAGVLTEQMRAVIVEAFRAPVINRYGSREVGDVGCSCLSDTGIHISERSYLIEILDEAGSPCAPGVEGNIVVTLFPNRTMPLIRYRIEDRAAWASGPCACGRNSRRLVTVLGRRNDFLLAADGTHINGTALTTLLYPVEGIHRFQYRQTAEGVFLSIVPRVGCDSELLKSQLEPLAERARRLLRGTPLKLTLVAQIPMSRSGKHRYVVNEIAMRE